MKHINSIFLFFGILIAICFSNLNGAHKQEIVYLPADKQERVVDIYKSTDLLQKAIISNNTRLFAKHFLFGELKSAEAIAEHEVELLSWANLIGQLVKYVALRNEGRFRSGMIHEAIATSNSISRRFMRKIDETRAKRTKVSARAAQVVFRAMKDTLEEAQANMNKEWYFVDRQKKEEARVMLNLFISYLIVAIEKAIKDVDKILLH